MLELLAPEVRVLLLTIGDRPHSDAIAAAIREPAFDWSRLMWLADREKAVTAVRHALAGMPAGVVPPQLMARLSRVSQVTEFRMLHLEQLLASALDTLAREHIDVVLLKGAGLATTVYGSFVARPMYDLDLLVRPCNAQIAWDALRAAGWLHNPEECPPSFYDSHYHLPPLDDPMRTGLALELHTAPTDGAIALTAEMLCEGARTVRLRHRSASVPSPVHQVLHLATHFAWTHGLASAAWRTFNDLERLVSSGTVDWDAVVNEANAVRAGTVCFWTFRLARSLGVASVPQRVLNRLKPRRPDWLLDLLERHYLSGLFQFSTTACPSVRATQVLWSLGMAPRSSGHGAMRPWQRGNVWAAASHGEARRSLFARMQGHGQRGKEWVNYLSAVFVSHSQSRQTT